MSLPVPSRHAEGLLRTCARIVGSQSTSYPRRTIQRCAFSSTSSSNQEYSTEHADRPRWQQTPKAMTMPLRVRSPSKQKPFLVNENPEVLNQVYNRLLGKGGDAMLPEEVKWLAVTHKSFDHGRRGFNDRLAFLGKRIVDLQCSLALLNAPEVRAQPSEVPAHPALEGLENVTQFSKQRTLDKKRLARLAEEYGIGRAMRWKPKKSENLQGSGVEVVLAHTMYSIVGALALQKGGDFATRVVKDRILSRLGL